MAAIFNINAAKLPNYAILKAYCNSFCKIPCALGGAINFGREEMAAELSLAPAGGSGAIPPCIWTTQQPPESRG